MIMIYYISLNNSISLQQKYSCREVEFGLWHHGHHNFLQTPQKIWKTHEAKLGGSFGFYWHCRHCCLPPLLLQAKPNNPDILRLNFLSQVFTSYLSLSTQADKKPCLIQQPCPNHNFNHHPNNDNLHRRHVENIQEGLCSSAFPYLCGTSQKLMSSDRSKPITFRF